MFAYAPHLVHLNETMIQRQLSITIHCGATHNQTSLSAFTFVQPLQETIKCSASSRHTVTQCHTVFISVDSIIQLL